MITKIVIIMIILKQSIIIVESLILLNDRCQMSKENQTLPPSDYDIYTESWMDLMQ